MHHHAYAIEAEPEQGIERAKEWAKKELGITNVGNNPDLVVLRYELLSVENARQVSEAIQGAPFSGAHKVIIIAASRAYHEAQNALLKIFEEPPAGAYLFLILPQLGSLLPTLRSRVQILPVGLTRANIPEEAREFLKGGREERSAIIKKLASGRDEEERRANRDEALAIVSGIEAAVYAQRGAGFAKSGMRELLRDIAVLRGYLNDRSAPVKMILEHLAIVAPHG